MLGAGRDGDEYGVGGGARVHVGVRWHGATYTSRTATAIPGEDAIELQLEKRSEGAWTVLDVGGEVDLSTAPALRQEVDSLIEDGVRDLIVDLERVSFMDSSGLGVLVAGHKRMSEVGGRVALVSREGPTMKILTITGLDRVFSIHPSVADAVAS